MTRFIAFLRAINVGGHIVQMNRLRELFESLGFSNVETFISSGNVVFETNSRNATLLERKIEKLLQEALGYEVATFIRTDKELAAIASYKPFRQADIDAAATFVVGFLPDALDEQARHTLSEFRTEFDDFHTHGREIYWLSLKKQSESTFSNARFERKLKRKATFRGANTVMRMAAKYSS